MVQISSNNSPQQVGTYTNWCAITGGGSHSSAIRADSTMWAWGANQKGQLGDGTLIDKYTPISVTCQVIGIEEYLYNSNFHLIYPNPSSNILNLKITDGKSIESYSIMDILGRKVLEQRKLYPDKH